MHYLGESGNEKEKNALTEVGEKILTRNNEFNTDSAAPIEEEIDEGYESHELMFGKREALLEDFDNWNDRIKDYDHER